MILLNVPFRVVEKSMLVAEKKDPESCDCGSKSKLDIMVKDPETEMEQDEIGDGVLIEGPVSSGVTDRDGDIVDPDAVMKSWDDYKKNPIILHNHQRGGIGRMIDVKMGEWPGLDHKVPIGRALIDGSEKDIVHKVRKGIIRAFSIGFIAKEGGIERMADDEGRISHRFTSIDWVETSVVDIPSNPMALFDVVKNAMKVQTKTSAPDSFNNPFSMWVFSKGEKMTDSEQLENVNDEEIIETEAPEIEEPTMEIKETPDLETEVVEDPAEDLAEDLADDVSPEEEAIVSPGQFKELESKVDAIVDAVLSLKEMDSTPEPVESEEMVALRAKVAELQAEKDAADLEARIASEVEARVKSIIGDQEVSVRTPERKSLTETPAISQDAFTQLAEERKTSVGSVKGEAWLATLLASRRKQ